MSSKVDSTDFSLPQDKVISDFSRLMLLLGPDACVDDLGVAVVPSSSACVHRGWTLVLPVRP